MARIINCHTHVFSGDHVPPLIAKTFLPWPFYHLLHLRVIISIFRWWYAYPDRIPFRGWYKKLAGARARTITRLGPVYDLFELCISILAFFVLYGILEPLIKPEKFWLTEWIDRGYKWIIGYIPLIAGASILLKIFFVLIVLLFFPSGRNMILFILKKLWKFMAFLPGKQTKEMFRRYLNIGRYAFHRHQNTILGKLKAQYPEDTGFIVLPMDMDYMNAGKSRTRYRDQMAELAEIKAEEDEKQRNIAQEQTKKTGQHVEPLITLFPFIFADPRRMQQDVRKEKRFRKDDVKYFDYTVKDGEIKLKDCFIKQYLDKGFSGIKIYPALGYYPFDEKLLPLWSFAARNSIPVLTHCIKGTIFYRGRKKMEWTQHPVFEQAMGNGEYAPLDLREKKNMDFSANFTHPLNYICLLKEPLLRKVIKKAIDDRNGADPYQLKEIFGYSDGDTELLHTLDDLKICFGHFGGDDEWNRFFEQERYDHGNQLLKQPGLGINFLYNKQGTVSKGKHEQLWKYTDWYSIICSIMLQHPNVYADISYILHDNAHILPLLKQTLQTRLKNQVLYGTDFFVVRNHKSDKNMLTDMLGGLSAGDFKQIAEVNPVSFL